MKKNITLYSALLLASALSSCSHQNTTQNIDSVNMANKSGDIAFLAFGDGGYHPDYPKKKHIKNPKNKAEFIEKERKDWLEDYRPIEEFNYSPIYIYPNTDIATEQSGAAAVGLAMTELCRQRDCDFAIQLGDNVYPDGADAKDGKDDQKRMDDLILKPVKPLFAQNKDLIVYSALGNHDWKSSRKGVQLQTDWMDNQPNFHLDEKGYYQYTMGEKGNDVEFFVLDTNMLLSVQPIYEVPLNSDGSEQDTEQAQQDKIGEFDYANPHENPVNGEDIKQLAWLKKGLENSTAKWKVVYGHHILWSIGGSKYSEGHVLREKIMPMLCENADAYIAGHEHDLELLTDDCSVYGLDDKPVLPLIISGAASKMRGKHTPFAEQQEKRYPEYDLVWSKSFVWGFAHITLDNTADTLNVEYFTTPTDQSGKAISEGTFSFKKR